MGIDLIARAMAAQGGGSGGGATYDLKLDKDTLKLIGSDGTTDKVKLPGSIQQGEAEGTLTSGVNAEAISQGSTAMGVDVVAGSKAFYIKAIDAENKKILLRETNEVPSERAKLKTISTVSSWLFENQYLDTAFNFDLTEPEVGVSYTLFINEIECGTAIAYQDGQYPRLRFEGSDFKFGWDDAMGWVFHEYKNYGDHVYEITSGNVSIRINSDANLESTVANGYEVGDEFSIIRGVKETSAHFAFCGTITSIEGNVITYANSVRTGVLSGGIPSTISQTSDLWAISEEDSTSRELWADCVFWVPKKPEIGFRIWNHDEENPEEIFQGINVFGDTNYGSADSAFLTGTSNAAGGNGATILGTRNRGAYGNIIGGGDNFSNGLHSMILGRYNTNLANYNVLVNMNNTVEAGSANNNNFLSGQYNKVADGSYNFIGGYNNLLTKGNGNILGGHTNTIANSTYSVIGGNAHKNIDGDQCIIAGNNHTISGRSHYNAIFGQSNTVASSSKWNEVSGNVNSLTYSIYNKVSGFTNTLTYAENNIVGGTENKLNGTSSVKLKNNLICGAKIKVTAGSGNILGGQENEIKSGNGNVIGGYNNALTGTYVGIFGNKHLVYGDQNFIVGTENSIGYDANKTASKKSSYNVVGGRGNKIGQTKQVWDAAVFGQNNIINHTGVLAVGANHTSSRDYQILFGNGAKEDSTSALILANSGTNILTFGTTGTRASVDTDAVTVKYLKDYINKVLKDFPNAEEAAVATITFNDSGLVEVQINDSSMYEQMYEATCDLTVYDEWGVDYTMDTVFFDRNGYCFRMFDQLCASGNSYYVRANFNCNGEWVELESDGVRFV